MFRLSEPLLGATLAVTASFMFAFQYLFVRLGTREGTVSDIVFVTLLGNVVILVPPAVVVYDFSMTGRALLGFTGTGLSGSLFARICMFSSIERIGANRTAPIVASNALFATLLAVFVLDESLTAPHFLGIVTIVVGVAAISYQTAESTAVTATRSELAILLVIPMSAALLLGSEPIFLSIALAEGAPLVPGTAVAVTAAFLGYTVYTGATTGLPSPSIVSEPYITWYVAAAVVTTIGLVTAFTAIEIAPVTVAVPLIQTSPLLVVGLSAVFISPQLEEVTPLIVVSTILIIGGAIVVSLSG